MPRADRAVRDEPFDGPLATAGRHVVGVAFGVFVRRLVRLETSDLPDDLNLGRRALLVTNHRSPLDHLIVVCACRRYGRWPAMFAREDFFARAPVRYLLRTLGLIPAARGRRAPEGLRRASRLLECGQVVAIAAEGGLMHAADRPDGVLIAPQGPPAQASAVIRAEMVDLIAGGDLAAPVAGAIGRSTAGG